MEATTGYPCGHALTTNLQYELREGYSPTHPPTYLVPTLTRILGVKLQGNVSSASNVHTTLQCFISYRNAARKLLGSATYAVFLKSQVFPLLCLWVQTGGEEEEEGEF